MDDFLNFFIEFDLNFISHLLTAFLGWFGYYCYTKWRNIHLEGEFNKSFSMHGLSHGYMKLNTGEKLRRGFNLINTTNYAVEILKVQVVISLPPENAIHFELKFTKQRSLYRIIKGQDYFKMMGPPNFREKYLSFFRKRYRRSFNQEFMTYYVNEEQISTVLKPSEGAEVYIWMKDDELSSDPDILRISYQYKTFFGYSKLKFFEKPIRMGLNKPFS